MSRVHEGSTRAPNVSVNIWWLLHCRQMTIPYTHPGLGREGTSWLRVYMLGVKSIGRRDTISPHWLRVETTLEWAPATCAAARVLLGFVYGEQRGAEGAECWSCGTFKYECLSGGIRCNSYGDGIVRLSRPPSPPWLADNSLPPCSHLSYPPIPFECTSLSHWFCSLIPFECLLAHLSRCPLRFFSSRAWMHTHTLAHRSAWRRFISPHSFQLLRQLIRVSRLCMLWLLASEAG